jgi:hypothetical protein
MIKELREIQLKDRWWVPYGRLILEILHQGGILDALSNVEIFSDAHLGTETGKFINSKTLKHWKLIKKVSKLSTDLSESSAKSNLMENFPPRRTPLKSRCNSIKITIKPMARSSSWMMYLKRCMVVLFQLQDAERLPPKKSTWKRSNLPRRLRRRRRIKLLVQ